MTIYFDTSSILPVLLQRHENHAACRDVLRRCLSEDAQLTTATHAYGECYRHLTRNVAPFELSPNLATTALSQLAELITFGEVTAVIYRAAIARCVRLRLRGAIIYDALHLETAIAMEANTLYTDNTKDFNRLLTPDESLRISGVR